MLLASSIDYYSWDLAGWFYLGHHWCPEHVPLDYAPEPYCLYPTSGCDDPDCCPQPLSVEDVREGVLNEDGYVRDCVSCLDLEYARNRRAPPRKCRAPNRTLLSVFFDRRISPDHLCSLKRLKENLRDS